MSLESHLVNWITSDTNLSPLIGNRVYPMFIPENVALPAISYQIISDRVELTMDGPALSRTPRVQLTIVADYQILVSQISELLKNRINAWSQTLPDMQIGPCFSEGQVYLALDYYTPPRSGAVIDAFISWKPV